MHDVAPLAFLRGVLCLNSHYRKSSSCQMLPAYGYAHHAYTTAAGPFYRPPSQDDVTIGVLGRLVRALDLAARAHAVRSGMPIYLTEFGVQSKPNRYLGVSPSQQAVDDAIAEKIAWSNSRVAAFSQYLLRDDPVGGPPGSSVNGGYVGFQTGLEYHDGRREAALLGVVRAARREHERPRLLAVGTDPPRPRRDLGDGARAQEGRPSLFAARDGAHEQPRLLEPSVLGRGRRLACALGEQPARHLRRPTDPGLVAAGASNSSRDALGPRPAAAYDEFAMPELPEVEITTRRLASALRGATIASAMAPGVNTLKTFDPPLSELEGARIADVSRRGKHLIVQTDSGLSLLVHLMSAGRLQLFEEPAPSSTNGRGRRATARSGSSCEWTDGRELRMREFGSKQAAWAKLLPTEALADDPALASLGPEAWPDTPPLSELLEEPRPLHASLRDQHVIAGIGRSWVDEILWDASLSPYKRGSDLELEEAERLRESITRKLSAALEHYEDVIELPIPDKLPMPLQVHRRVGEPCPRCGAPIAGVHFEDYIVSYCPECQTGGRVLKDRRLSRILK